MRKEIVKRLDYTNELLEELLVQLALMQDNFFRAIGEYLDITIVNDFDNFEFSYTLKDTLQDMLYELYQKIDKETNPLSEQNAAEFNAALTNVRNNTFIGSAYELTETLPDKINNSLTTDSSPVLTFKTAAVKNSFFEIPAREYSIDFSWYAPFKGVGDTVISCFIYLGFLIAFFKRLPEIIHGAGIIRDFYSDFEESKINDQMASDFYNTLVDHNGRDEF
ncbi:MAG: hypothetical protein ACI4IK_00130 [Eubacterium sp.]